jgi:hypothetical protein
LEWLAQVLTGTPDEAAVEHLRRGFEIWLNSGRRAVRGADGKLIRARPLALSRCLGLPDKPELVRLRQRDDYLRQAAALIRADLAPSQSVAAALCREAQRFAGHRWLCWVALTQPPPNADELDRLLFLAMRAGGGRLPTTGRQFASIVKS